MTNNLTRRIKIDFNSAHKQEEKRHTDGDFYDECTNV